RAAELSHFFNPLNLSEQNFGDVGSLSHRFHGSFHLSVLSEKSAESPPHVPTDHIALRCYGTTKTFGHGRIDGADHFSGSTEIRSFSWRTSPPDSVGQAQGAQKRVRRVDDLQGFP